MSDVPGIIYVVKNPAWPTWVKVGRAEGQESDAENVMKRRLYQYNTGDPGSAYEVAFKAYAACCRTAERFAHDFLDGFCFRGAGEWYQQREEDVIRYVKEAARIGRLHPSLRSLRYTEIMTEIRESVEDDTIQIVAETRRDIRPLSDPVPALAKATRSVIQELLERLPEPDERLESAAKIAMRFCDTLEEA